MSRKFKGFFRPKLGDLQKKKKRSSPKFRTIFLPISQVQTFEGGSFRMGGGAIFHFSQKIGLKSTKNMRFCILHKPMGGARAPPPPPPPLATLLVITKCNTVLPGKAQWYISVILLVYFGQNANLFQKYATLR